MLNQQKGNAGLFFLIILPTIIGTILLGLVHIIDNSCRFLDICPNYSMTKENIIKEAQLAQERENKEYEIEKTKIQKGQKQVSQRRVKGAVDRLLKEVKKSALKGNNSVLIFSDTAFNLTQADFDLVVETMKQKGFILTYQSRSFHVKWE